MTTPAVRAALTLLLVAVARLPASAQSSAEELKKLSIQELMEIPVTVATRRPEPVGTVAAAATVITRDDIRRSGVTTIADALALADGVHVARVNSGSWAISARGFNGSTPNKLLVMVDGRTEFSPFFAGVFWNMLDYVLEDVERIEVIRGPSGTMWGANAVNGVVNIVTRSARQTRGTYVSAGAGNEDHGLVEARYGRGTDRLSYRVSGKVVERDQQKLASGEPSDDGRTRGQIGMRLDGVSGATEWMFKADAFHSRDHLFDRRDAEWTGLGGQARFSHRLSPRSTVQVQTYYRREYRNVERQLTHHLDTGDVEIQHAVGLGTRHEVVYGGGARRNSDVIYGSQVLQFDPPRRIYPVFNAFVQDEMTVRPASLFVTGGVKFEHNAFSGGTVQPSVRVRWMLPHQQMIWGALARAVRRPTRFDDDLRLLQNGVVIIQGSDDFRAEDMVGWDIGYRSHPFGFVSFDVNVFSQDYDQLRSQESPPTGVFPLTIGNTLNGVSRGLELSVTVQPRPWWRTRLGYTRLETGIGRDPGSRDLTNGAAERNDPDHMFTLRSSVDLPQGVAVDGWLRGVSELPSPIVPGYLELNARLGWNATSKVELALVGQDLLHGQHQEAGSTRRIDFERSIRALLTLRIP